MSGPVYLPDGSADGIDWSVREDLGATMIFPPEPHGTPLTPPEYWPGPTPYYGDFQITPVGSPSSLALVIEFSQPIQQFRTTAQFVPDTGFRMHAVADEAGFVGHDPFTGPIFVSAAMQAWEPNTSGTRTLTLESGFRFVVLTSQPTSSPLLGFLGFGPTFRNSFFEQTIAPAVPIVVVEPDQRVPRGAGRLVSFAWPDLAFPGNAGGFVVRPRVTQTQVMVSSPVAPQPPGGATLTYKGQRALVLAGRNGFGSSYAPLTGGGRPFTMYPALERTPSADLTLLDETGCHRLLGIFAFDQPTGPVTWDCGLVVGVGLSNRIRNGTQPGMSLGLTNIGTVALSTRQVEGGAMTVHDLGLAPGFDVTQWHKYELRIIPATLSADAVLRVLIDDAVMKELAWGAGSVLPLPFTGAPTQWGYSFAIVNLGGGVDFIAKLYIAYGGVQYHVAMTEDALI